MYARGYLIFLFLQDLFIQDFNTFHASSEKVRCSTCDVYILKSRMISHVGKHLALNEHHETSQRNRSPN